MKFKRPSRTNALTASIARVLSYSGYNVWRQNNGAIFDRKKEIYRKNPLHKKGVPDIIGYSPGGIFIGIEIKTGRDKLSDEQKLFFSDLNKAGGLGFVVKDWDEFTVKAKEILNLNV